MANKSSSKSNNSKSPMSMTNMLLLFVLICAAVFLFMSFSKNRSMYPPRLINGGGLELTPEAAEEAAEKFGF